MAHTDFKHSVDNLMNILWGGGVANHSTIIEQINYLVFLRSLSKKDDRAMILDPEAERIFSGELSQYHWDNLLMLNAESLFATLEEIFRRLPELVKDRTIQQLFRDAHVKVFDKPTLRRLLHEIEKMMSELDEEAMTGHTDIFGDMYEYLLSKLSQAGTLGSFRTPRHIIKFIVDVIDPEKGETILDPSCGTAGFLVAALKHLEEKYTSEDLKKINKPALDLLKPEERQFLFQHTFTGFDSDFDMFKFGMMNMYLHHLENPNIKRQNTLVDTAGDRTKWDVILANPPFAGAIDADGISEDLQMGTRSTEILFLRYIIDHLSANGRAGVIVPEGIIFSGTNAHKKIRQMLIEDAGLWAVASLPAGVFNPYAGVKTSILFFDRSLSNKAKHVLFVKIENDGFDLGAQRRSIVGSDLPMAVEVINGYKESLKKGEELDKSGWPNNIAAVVGNPLCSFVAKKEINSDGVHNLAYEHYKEEVNSISQQWPIASLEEVCELKRGVVYSKKDEVSGGGNKILRANNISIDNNLVLDDIKHIASERQLKDEQKLVKDDIFICLASGSKKHVGKVAYVDEDTDYYFGGFMGAIRVVSDKILPKYLYVLLKDQKFNNFLNREINGANINNLNYGILSRYKIPLPPIEIQTQIIEEIEVKQKAIDAAREVIKNLERERQYFGREVEQLEGVRRVKLGDVLKYEQPTKYIVHSDRYSNEYHTPVLTAGKTFILGNTDETDGIYSKNDLPVIIFDDFTTATQFVDFEFKVKSSAMKILSVRDPAVANIKFLYLLMQGIQFNASTHKRYWISEYSTIDVPLPSIDVQNRMIEEFSKEEEAIAINQRMITLFEDKILSILNNI